MKTAIILTAAGLLVGTCIVFFAAKEITEYTYRTLVHLGDV